jgi:hypothetical protein
MKQRMRQTLLAGCGSVALCLGVVAARADDASIPAQHQAAVWQKRNYSFAFLGFTTTYSCDGLADKLKLLLLASGARADVKASAGACANGFGRPDKFARADLTFYALVPADHADPALADPAANGALDGVWHQVTLARRQPRELGTGDCELVEQFKSNVLPLLTTRNIEEHTTCIPHQDSGSVIDLKFEALAAAAPPQPAARH